jgi:Pet100
MPNKQKRSNSAELWRIVRKQTTPTTKHVRHFHSFQYHIQHKTIQSYFNFIIMAKGRQGFYLEGGKFAIYILVPIGLSWYYADPKRQKRAIDYWKFITVPATPNVDMRQHMLDLQKQEQQRQVYREQLRNLEQQANKTTRSLSTSTSTTTTSNENEEKKSRWRWIGLGR